jgi:hypothetical protein
MNELQKTTKNTILWGKVPKSNRKIIETKKKSIPLTHTYNT